LFSGLLVDQHPRNFYFKNLFNSRRMENEIGIKWFFWIGTVVMFFSVLITILTVVLYRNKILNLNKKEAENLLKSSLESEKQERKRIASDFHDSVSGDLNAVQN